jgi:hypothetical protein
MPRRVANVLESYDFFGKSIPGIVGLVGIFSLLPGFPLSLFGTSDSQMNVAVLTALALTLVFLGLVIGQPVHTIADNVEKALYRIGSWGLNKYYVRGPLLSSAWWGNNLRLKSWLERRYWGIHDVFKSHRRLFENELGWHFDISVNKRGSGNNDISYDYFRRCCKEEFQIDIARFDKTTTDDIILNGYVEFRQLYPLVTATLSSKGSGRANGFQARYSFCRGMWAVLLILSLLYFSVLHAPIGPKALVYEPIILQVLDRDELGILIWAMVFLSFAFMDASGDYKKHYVEYLISDFCAAVDRGTQEEKAKTEENEEKIAHNRKPPYYH